MTPQGGFFWLTLYITDTLLHYRKSLAYLVDFIFCVSYSQHLLLLVAQYAWQTTVILCAVQCSAGGHLWVGAYSRPRRRTARGSSRGWQRVSVVDRLTTTTHGRPLNASTTGPHRRWMMPSSWHSSTCCRPHAASTSSNLTTQATSSATPRVQSQRLENLILLEKMNKSLSI